MKYEVLDKDGNKTALYRGLVYKIKNKDQGQTLWVAHGDADTRDDNVAAKSEVADSSDCEWSLHLVPETTNKYYIVTKGKILHAGHGASDTANWGWGGKKVAHVCNGLGKTGERKSSTERHKTNAESRWEIERVGNGDERWYKLSTSHKVLWLPSNMNGNNKNGDVKVMNKSSGALQLDMDEVVWEFVPQLAGTYETEIYDFKFENPFTNVLTGPDPSWSPDRFLFQPFNNPSPEDGGPGVSVTNSFTASNSFDHMTTIGFSETASMTLNKSASISIAATVPGMGGPAVTTASGLALTASLSANQSVTVKRSHSTSLSTQVTIPAGTKGTFIAKYYTSDYNVDFTCMCKIKVSVLQAPEEWRAVADPEVKPAKDVLVKAALKGAGFDKPDSQVVYDGNTVTFSNSGTMSGKAGCGIFSEVIYDEPPEENKLVMLSQKIEQ